MSSLLPLWPELQAAAERNGALRIGVAPLADPSAGVFEQWLERDLEGSMRYLRKNLEVRKAPATRYPWARSALAITVPYSPERPDAPEGTLARHLARYALGDDYHDVLDGILRELERIIAAAVPEARTRRYVDTGPLSDRAIAVQAGLGWIGKNGMLIDPESGSWVFIGALLTSLEPFEQAAEVADRCGTCTRCIDACPTSAILPGKLVDGNRCISHATIEQRGAIPEAIKGSLAGNLFGCDICQEVCPWNEPAPPGHPAFLARDAYRATPVSDLLRGSQEAFSTLFRRSPVKRAKRTGMARNAILLGCEVDPAEDLTADPGVADAMAWRTRYR